ncbi:MraY family glycosyltransferase [Streptomyces sp. S.PB5]|uniref:MraY family glycosyltransferase n=1 Tax=Streptomyces sp. S.PB5 TaxID=3020844 RepID=UPI0025AF2814|nr:MraY family glycosyltransferase [Streptomyces sp. S.PB5]MDN3023471.1 MraY family glycosyltransferase [Streptomyces sp. S.PB5]
MLYGIAAATSALLLSAVLAALLRAPALRLGLTDRRRQRKVPLAGGVAVVGVTVLVVVVGDRSGVAPLGDGIGRLVGAAAGVAVLGLLADVWRVKPRVLVVGTAVAAAFVVPYEETGLAGGVLAVGWIVFVALGFRALDHADGLAGGVGIVTAFGGGLCAAAEVMDGPAVVLSVLAASLAGFLMHNWPPARVGLGSCGSLFAGFLPAAVVVTARAGYGLADSAAVLVSLTLLVGADVLLVLLSRRFVRGVRRRGGPDHLGHRLRQVGVTPQGIVVVLGAGAFSGVLVAVLVHLGTIAASGALWGVGGVLVAVFALLRIKPGIKPSSTPRPTSPQVGAQLRVRNG